MNNTTLIYGGDDSKVDMSTFSKIGNVPEFGEEGWAEDIRDAALKAAAANRTSDEPLDIRRYYGEYMEVMTDFRQDVETLMAGESKQERVKEFESFRRKFRTMYLAYLRVESRYVPWTSTRDMSPEEVNALFRRERRFNFIRNKRRARMGYFWEDTRLSLKKRFAPDPYEVFLENGSPAELKEKMHLLKGVQAYMVEVNAALYRAGKGKRMHVAALREMGLDDDAIKKVLAPNECGKAGFSTGSLVQNKTRIGMLEGRLAQLERNGKEEA